MSGSYTSHSNSRFSWALVITLTSLQREPLQSALDLDVVGLLHEFCLDPSYRMVKCNCNIWDESKTWSHLFRCGNLSKLGLITLTYNVLTSLNVKLSWLILILQDRALFAIKQLINCTCMCYTTIRWAEQSVIYPYSIRGKMIHDNYALESQLVITYQKELSVHITNSCINVSQSSGINPLSTEL